MESLLRIHKVFLIGVAMFYIVWVWLTRTWLSLFLVPTEREMVKRFIEGFNFGIRYGMARVDETGATFHQALDTTRHLEHIDRQERGVGYQEVPWFRWF